MIAQHIARSKIDNLRRDLVRLADDFFTIENNGVSHLCTVLPPLGISLSEYIARQPCKGLSIAETRYFLFYLLCALEFLHTCNVVHTGECIHTTAHLARISTSLILSDIKFDNIQLVLPEERKDNILASILNAPTRYKKVDNDRYVYESAVMNYGDPMAVPILCDLDAAVHVERQCKGLVQPKAYRAPEVYQRLEWDSSADIWNLGVLVCHIALCILICAD